MEKIETLQASKLPYESQEKSMEANHNNIKKAASKHKFQKDSVEGWIVILKELVLGTFKDQKTEELAIHMTLTRPKNITGWYEG